MSKMRTVRRKAMKIHRRSSVGPRCRTFGAGCICCAMWMHMDRYGFFPHTFDAAYQFNKELEKQYDFDADYKWEDVQ